jgi:phenylalanyl-tRNA synthetase alpha chain
MSPIPPLMTADDVRRALSIRDLTDPLAGAHAMQTLVDDVVGALASAWRCTAALHRARPVVTANDNYDRLRYPKGGAARAARYTRYLTEGVLLRTQTSAMIPPLLRVVASIAHSAPLDVLLACPGLVYRRDTIDRLHTGEPHQLDLWRIRATGSATPLDACDLEAMIATVVAALLPGAEQRALPAEHPYTTDGRQIDVRSGDDWIEIGECGLAHPDVLADAGLSTPQRCASGLAMGIGLDRVLMLRKGIDDIRFFAPPIRASRSRCSISSRIARCRGTRSCVAISPSPSIETFSRRTSEIACARLSTIARRASRRSRW